MKKNRDIVILYGPPWDQPAQLSKHHFARLWAHDRRVLYVEAPVNPVSFITRKQEAKRLWKRYKNGPEKVCNNLWVTTFFYPLPYRGSRYLLGGKWVNNINQYFVKKKLKKQISELGFINPVLFIGGAHALPLLDDFKDSLKIYHCSDDYTLVPSFPQSFTDIESKFIKKCDLVVTTTDELKRSKQHLNSNIISIPNGADIDHFAQTQNEHVSIAKEIRVLPKPVIGYIGSIFRWLHQEWIDYAARINRDYSFVFIGPITTDISKLQNRKNIFFLGPRPYDSLPQYLKGFDVATIPFTIDGVTLKASPIKFYEYLASGLPIVSTELPDLKPFGEITFLVKNKKQFSDQLNIAIKSDNSELRTKRMEISKKFSWETRFNELKNQINNII
ncbi:MAG: glycosyltransferase [Bacteroidales bacterium]|nr:glycosyltransferase [Bacteroidales bacterium]